MKFLQYSFVLAVFISLNSCKVNIKQENNQGTINEMPIVASILEDENYESDFLAYTWFGRPNYAFSETAQKYWIGSTKDTPDGTTQHITEYDLTKNIFRTIKVGTVYEKDDHNQAELIIRHSDSRLITFYTEHRGAALRYRISINPLDAGSWGDEIALNPLSSDYSYISPYQTSKGDIFIFYRSFVGCGEVRWYYMKSTDGGLIFGNAVEFYNNGATQNYLISNQQGNKVHFTASNGHPQTNSDININVYHFYFDLETETFYRTDGSAIAGPIEITKVSTVVETTGNDTSWILDISFKNKLPRIIYVLYPDGRTNGTPIKELWYVEWNGINWVNNQKIAETLNGYIDIEDDTTIQEKAYSGASRFDTANPDIIWMPKQINDILEIHKVDLSVSPISIEQITFDSEMDNWRPISVPSPEKNLLWLKINNYNHYKDYSMELQSKTVN